MGLEFKVIYKKGDKDKKIFGLSNGKLNDNWPKVGKTKEYFLQFLSKNSGGNDIFYWNFLKNAMTNNKRYELKFLPNTGITPEHEVFLSSLFIDGKNYGTQSTIFFGIHKDSSLSLFEQTYNSFAKVESSKNITVKFHDVE